MSAPKSKRLSALVRDLERAADKQVRASRARAALPPGSSRARVTTANARHKSACEAVERLLAEIRDSLKCEGWERSIGASLTIWAAVLAEAERVAEGAGMRVTRAQVDEMWADIARAVLLGRRGM